MRSRCRLGCGSALAAFLLLGVLPLALQANGPVEAAVREFDHGAYANAIHMLLAESRKNPGDARIYYWLCRSYFELRDFNNAIVYGDGAVRAEPDNSEYWFCLGKAYGRKAEAERSLSWATRSKEAFEKAVELDAKNIPARRALIEYLTEAPALIAGGSKSRAREHIAVLAAQDPVQGKLAWGYYWRETDELDRAEAAYREALDLKPKNPAAYFEAADFYRRIGNLAQMEAAIEAGAKANPADARLHFWRGVVRVMAGNRLEEAERLLKTYAEKAPQRGDYPAHAGAYEWLGKLYERMNRCGDAVASYRKALELQPGRRESKDALKRLRCS
jgi:cytochrome c-type biogenesis protein CcmH/NrfG